MNLIFIVIFIMIAIHIPRLYIECKSRLLKKNKKLHGEDSYQKSRNMHDNINRLFGWAQFEMSENDWEDYKNIITNELINLYRKEFSNLLRDVPDRELVSFKNAEHVKSYIPAGEVVSTWIDDKNKIIRTCFNHEWCSGYFFLQYGAVIYRGRPPNPAKYPNIPFIPEYNFLKLVMNKPFKPISSCFQKNIARDDIKRINYNVDLLKKPYGISSRTYLLWNVMVILNSVYSKDYNIMIPIPFKKLKNVWNNIGVIFVKWPKNGMTMIELETTIKKNIYHAIATNLYLRGVVSSPSGINARKDADIVFTSGYIQNVNAIPKYHCATFNEVADYGIYCLTATMGTLTSISFTFSTNEIDFEKVVKIIDKKYNNYKLF